VLDRTRPPQFPPVVLRNHVRLTHHFRRPGRCKRFSFFFFLYQSSVNGPSIALTEIGPPFKTIEATLSVFFSRLALSDVRQERLCLLLFCFFFLTQCFLFPPRSMSMSKLLVLLRSAQQRSPSTCSSSPPFFSRHLYPWTRAPHVYSGDDTVSQHPTSHFPPSLRAWRIVDYVVIFPSFFFFLCSVPRIRTSRKRPLQSRFPKQSPSSTFFLEVFFPPLGRPQCHLFFSPFLLHTSHQAVMDPVCRPSLFVENRVYLCAFPHPCAIAFGAVSSAPEKLMRFPILQPRKVLTSGTDLFLSSPTHFEPPAGRAFPYPSMASLVGAIFPFLPFYGDPVNSPCS